MRVTVLLRDQAESQYENRISRIDSGQAVVAALVHEDKMAAELDLIWIAHPRVLRKPYIAQFTPRVAHAILNQQNDDRRAEGLWGHGRAKAMRD
jgi:hypothetical protein